MLDLYPPAAHALHDVQRPSTICSVAPRRCRTAETCVRLLVCSVSARLAIAAGSTANCLRCVHLQARSPDGVQHERVLLHGDFLQRRRRTMRATVLTSACSRFMCCCASALSVRSLAACRRALLDVGETESLSSARFFFAVARQSLRSLTAYTQYELVFHQLLCNTAECWRAFHLQIHSLNCTVRGNASLQAVSCLSSALDLLPQSRERTAA